MNSRVEEEGDLMCVYTGNLRTAFRIGDNIVAAAQIALLQQEIERLRLALRIHAGIQGSTGLSANDKEQIAIALREAANDREEEQ